MSAQVTRTTTTNINQQWQAVSPGDSVNSLRAYRTEQRRYPRQKEMFRTGRKACLLFEKFYKMHFTAKNA